MESITREALPLLETESSPQGMEDDWITNFFERSRIVSDKDMQRLWSKVLAGEANAPGRFSKRTVNLLSDLDKRDAELFTRLCGFGWIVQNLLIPLVFDVKDKIYTGLGINFTTLGHLETIGLIKLGNLAGFQRMELPKSLAVYYYGTPVELTFPNDAHNTLDVGKVILTQAGDELARVCGPRQVQGFFEFVYQRWERQSLIPKKNTQSGGPATT